MNVGTLSVFEKSSMQCKDRVRHFTKAKLNRTYLLTDKSIDLSWLCYSESVGKVYCFTCKLISRDASSFTEVVNDWRNVPYSIKMHSQPTQHIQLLTDITLRKATESTGYLMKNKFLEILPKN